MKNAEIVKMTIAQFITMLLTWNFGAQPATIQYGSEPKIKKDGKLRFGNIFKLGAVNCIIDYDFEKAVRRQQAREGIEPNFVVSALWNGKGEHINRRLVRHTDTDVKYLAYKHERTLRSLHFDSALNFIPNVLLKPYFYATSAPTNQGVEKYVKPRTLKLANIRKVKMMGKTYEIIPS